MLTKFRLYVCAPNKIRDKTLEIVSQLSATSVNGLSFDVVSAVTHTDQSLDGPGLFSRNVELIRSSQFFVAVLKDYGKDLAAEVGMAYALDIERVGLDFGANPADVMVYYSLPVIQPDKLGDWAVSKLNALF